MKNRTIIFTKPYKAEFLERDVREPGQDEVLVKTVVSSISSGTERANFVGDPNVSIYTGCSVCGAHATNNDKAQAVVAQRICFFMAFCFIVWV